MHLSQRQTVYRTFSETPTSGYFVWEVSEVVGNPDLKLTRTKNLYTECIDGTLIYILCLHFFDKASALAVLYEPPVKGMNQTIYIASGMPELTAQEYKEYLKYA